MHKTVYFERCDVLNFYELTIDSQREILSIYEEDAENGSYLETARGPISLQDFMRVNSKLWDGARHISNVAGELIKFSSCGTVALYCVRVY
jgi:hypothetical protein